MTNSLEKILIIGPSWVGDMVMAQSLFKLLKQKNKNCLIDVLAPSWTNPLLSRMKEVRRAIELPFSHGQLQLKKRYQFGKMLRAENYQHAILLPNSLKSALIPFWAKIPKRTGWLGEMRYGLLNDWRKLDKKALPLMIERFMALALEEGEKLVQPYPYPSLEVSQENIATAQKKHQLATSEKPILALCPGAEFGPAKRWPADYYAQLANKKIAEGWQVYLFGSENDQIITASIQANTNNSCVDLAGKTSLAEAIDLLSSVTVVVSNDSGLMHIAAALNKPLVVLYGSSDPSFTPPLAGQVEILRLGLSCSPCFQKECPLQHFNCMNHLTVDSVLEALEKLTAKKKM